MKILCGTDIIEIERLKKSIETLGDSFLNKVFTKNEISYCELKRNVKYESYAARFAAKESVSKVLGTGISEGVAWKDIEIINNASGKPEVHLHGKAKQISDNLNVFSISISLSHCKNYAVAYACALASE